MDGQSGGEVARTIHLDGIDTNETLPPTDFIVTLDAFPGRFFEITSVREVPDGYEVTICDRCFRPHFTYFNPTTQES